MKIVKCCYCDKEYELNESNFYKLKSGNYRTSKCKKCYRYDSKLYQRIRRAKINEKMGK